MDRDLTIMSGPSVWYSKVPPPYRSYFYIIVGCLLRLIRSAVLDFGFFGIYWGEMRWLVTKIFFFRFRTPQVSNNGQKQPKTMNFSKKKIFLFFTGPFMKEDQRNLREKFGKWPYFENMSTKIYVWGGHILAKSSFS